MNEKSKQNLYELLRDISDFMGIARITVLALQSLIASIKELKCDRAEIGVLLTEFIDVIKESEPKIIPLIHLLEAFEDEIKKYVGPDNADLEEVKTQAVKILTDKIELFRNNARKVTEHGLEYIRDNDVIIVHSASSVVTDILVRAREVLDRNFRVIVLEHNIKRTRQLIQALEKAGIAYEVVPAYNLDHYIEQATKMFVGALTVTSDRKIVAPAGSAGTISLCHVNNVTVHLFANTLHFSHRKSMDQRIYRSRKDMHAAGLKYSLSTHSHCLVDLDLIDHVITESGEMNKIAYSRYMP